MQSVHLFSSAPESGQANLPEAAGSWKSGIEVLRGIAAVSVMMFHCVGLLPWPVSGTPLAIFNIGWIGVDVFFVISGYVITASSIRQKSQPDYARYFWRARLARILPLYYVTSLVFLSFISAAALDKQAALQILSHLFLMHNFFQDAAFSINGVTWSLSVELQFYLLAFFVAPLMNRVPRVQLFAGFFLLLSGVLSYRLVAWRWLRETGASEAAFIHMYSQLPALLESFALGALLCVLKLVCVTRGQIIALGLLASTMLVAIYCVYTWNAPHYWDSLIMAVLFRSLVAAFAGLMLLLAISLRAKTSLGPLLELGKLSYGIYLWHLVVLYLVQRYAPFKATAAVLCIIVLTMALAKLSYVMIEQPFMRWAHKARF